MKRRTGVGIARLCRLGALRKTNPATCRIKRSNVSPGFIQLSNDILICIQLANQNARTNIHNSPVTHENASQSCQEQLNLSVKQQSANKSHNKGGQDVLWRLEAQASYFSNMIGSTVCLVLLTLLLKAAAADLNPASSQSQVRFVRVTLTPIRNLQ